MSWRDDGEFIMDRVKNLLRWMKGFGILAEVIFLFIINYYILIPLLSINNYIENGININSSATETIAILTVFVLSIGFIYYIGFITASRRKHRLVKHGRDFKAAIIFNGALFFLAIFLPLLIVLLLESDQSNIMKYMTINIGSVWFFGYINEILFDNKIFNGNRERIILTTQNDTKKFLELYQTTDVDYRFKDSDNNEHIIPIGQVKEIEYLKTL